mgnify:CR=1 FL=1
MDAERWRRLSPLLDALLELEPRAREASLAELRSAEPRLADELAALLALEDGADNFLGTPLVAPLPGARPGTQVGPYRLERLLGEGGMGQVWLASRADGLYQRRVALKLLRPGLADPGLRLRFTREREILARLGVRRFAPSALKWMAAAIDQRRRLQNNPIIAETATTPAVTMAVV